MAAFVSEYASSAGGSGDLARRITVLGIRVNTVFHAATYDEPKVTEGEGQGKALPLADHSHHLEAFDGGVGRSMGLRFGE